MNKNSQTTQTECYTTVALVHCTFDGLMVKYNQKLVLQTKIKVSVIKRERIKERIEILAVINNTGKANKILITINFDKTSTYINTIIYSKFKSV